MKIFLIILILNYLFGSKRPSSYLCCGLFGWSGKNPSVFNRHAFAILGIENEFRGRDSCGVYSSRSIKYGININSSFTSFIKKIDHIRAGKDCVVLGHTRKASIGIATLGNAQPIGIKNKEDSLGFIFTHNGTLENHVELAKKYKLGIKNLNTDSQILASLMYNTEAELNILKEYEGGAALAFHYVGDNSIFLFKGKSSGTSATAWESEERPLYVYQESKYSLYYSSTKDSLLIIAKDKSKITDLKPNIIYKVTGGELTEEAKIDRSDRYQRYVAPYKRAKTYHYDMYDGSFENWFPNSRIMPPAQKIQYHNPAISINSEPLVHMGCQMLVFVKGRFHLGENLAHGRAVVSKFGLVLDKDKIKETTDPFFVIYFWEGVLLNDLEAYSSLVKLKKETNFLDILDEQVLQNTPYPVAYYHNGSNNNKLYTNCDTTTGSYDFEGKISPIFSTRAYFVEKGLLVRTIINGTINKLKSEKIEHLNYWE